MTSTDNPSYDPFFSDPSMGSSRSRRSLASSIWAPQPQASETTWPNAFDAFSRVINENEDIQTNVYRPVTKEDVFGPVKVPAASASHRSIGAIGEGRKQQQSSDNDDLHVEQLLRTLNLNSPGPYVRPPPLALNFETTPSRSSGSLDDFSPISAGSGLLTPVDLSPARPFDTKLHSPYEINSPSSMLHSQSTYSSIPNLNYHNSLQSEYSPPNRFHDHHLLPSPQFAARHLPPSPLRSQSFQSHSQSSQIPGSDAFGFHETISDHYMPDIISTPSRSRVQNDFISSHSPLSPLQQQSYYTAIPQTPHHQELRRVPSVSWNQPMLPTPSEWLRPEEKPSMVEFGLGLRTADGIIELPNRREELQQSPLPPRFSFSQQPSPVETVRSASHESINFLSLLHPSSSPPYHIFVARIIKSSDQQASIFLQQKLKVAESEERGRILDAVCAKGYEMMAHRFGNWAVQRCLEAAVTTEERRKIVDCMKGRVVELATNCYGCHVLQKALDCEEDIRLAIVSELLTGDPAQTLVNKHASHVWSKIMELTWTEPAPPIFAFVNKSLQGKWASLACHETGSLVVQHAFENLEESAKDGIVNELLNQGPAVFGEVCMNQWGSYCIQHLLEHGSVAHRALVLDHLLSGLVEYATNEQGNKSVSKAIKEGGKDTLDKIIKRMCEPAKSARRAMIVDLALSVNGSQLIASVLPNADKDQRAQLYECIRSHIVTLRGCKTGSKVIWLFDRMV